MRWRVRRREWHDGLGGEAAPEFFLAGALSKSEPPPAIPAFGGATRILPVRENHCALSLLWGTGEVTGLGYGNSCPECHDGSVDTVRRWLRAWRHLGGRSLAALFLSSAAGLMFGIPAVLALCFVSRLCGVPGDPDIGMLYAGVAGLIAVGLFGSFWLEDGGPARPGRGMAQKWAKWPTVMAACSPFVVSEAYSGDPRKPIRQVVAYFLTALVFAFVMAFQCAIVVFIFAVMPIVWFLFGADHLMDDFSLMPLRIIASASGVAFFVFVWCDKSGPPRLARGLFHSRRSEAPPQIVLDYVEKTKCFTLMVSRANRRRWRNSRWVVCNQVQQLMRDHGLQLSIPASTPETACLYTRDPHAVAAFAEHATLTARTQFVALAGAEAFPSLAIEGPMARPSRTH